MPALHNNPQRGPRPQPKLSLNHESHEFHQFGLPVLHLSFVPFVRFVVSKSFCAKDFRYGRRKFTSKDKLAAEIRSTNTEIRNKPETPKLE